MCIYFITRKQLSQIYELLYIILCEVLWLHFCIIQVRGMIKWLFYLFKNFHICLNGFLLQTEKQLYVTTEGSCLCITKNQWSEEEEADIRIIHAAHAATEGYSAVVEGDIDVLVVILAFSSDISCSLFQKYGRKNLHQHHKAMPGLRRYCLQCSSRNARNEWIWHTDCFCRLWEPWNSIEAIAFTAFTRDFLQAGTVLGTLHRLVHKAASLHMHRGHHH